MSADAPDETPVVTPPPLSEQERAMREAEARALAESGLGSGLLARQPALAEEESVAVLKVCPQCGKEYETAARFCPDDGTALRPKGSDSLVGRVLADRYHILKRIGEGGMGRVYLGEHVKMNRQCAIKVMSPALVNDAESAARFAREASNAARIIHPNVAAVFDYGESDSLVYLVMEYVDGEPLSKLLQREAPFALERAMDLGRQIADGLGAAHELGIIHRDLKPDNILVMRTRVGKEVIKIVDFGIAKAVQEGAGEALTRTGLVIGTPEFMSPEQLLGDPIDARSDLYALGCILHLMVTAAPPFEATTREQMIKRRLSEDAPSVHAVEPDVPDSVARIVARLLARSPSDRYGSAAEVRDALGGTHGRRSGGHRAASRETMHTPRSAPTVAFLATQATTQVTKVPPASVRRWRGAIITVVTAVAAVSIALAIRQRPAEVAAGNANARVDDTVRSVPPGVGRADSGLLRRDPSPVVVVPNPVMVDSLREQYTRQRRDDSIRFAADYEKKESTRAVVLTYVKAFESGNASRLRDAYRGITPQAVANWEQTFAKAEKIDANVRWNGTSVRGDSAFIYFTLNLNFVLRDTKQRSTFTQRQLAKLARRNGAWEIVSLTQT